MTAPPALVGLHRRLPSKWPTQDQPGVNAEDYWYQALLDLVLILVGLVRDPASTGSQQAIQAAGPPYGGSDNHERKERTVECIRDSDTKPVLDFFAQEAKEGMCLREMGARYMPRFHAADVYAAWIVAKLRGQTSVLKACELWLSWFKWWLMQSAFNGPKPPNGPWLKPMIYSGGMRRAFSPDPRDTFQYYLHTGRKFNPDKMPGDATTKGGYPGATDVWLGLAATQMGLDLDALAMVKPPMQYELRFERSKNRLLSYFPPILKWRPVFGDILVACEVTRGDVNMWLVEEKDQVPGPVWGFDPKKMEIVVV